MFGLTPFRWLHSIMLNRMHSIILYGNINFYLHLFNIHLHFLKHNKGIKQGLGLLSCKVV